ncbi:MAG: hypothetical protein ACR2NN_00070 [Bryobacteraceae bacterium]
MNPGIFDKPFFEVTLPLVVTIVSMVWLAVWSNNKRLDDINGDINRRSEEAMRRFDKIDARLDKMDARLERIEFDHGTRLTKLEERAWR